MTSGGGQVEEARPFPMINSNDSTTSSPTLSSIDSYDENMGGMGVSDQCDDSPGAKGVHPGERVFNWPQQQNSGGDNSSEQPVTLTNINHLTPISPSNEDVHSAEQYKHPVQPSVLRYPFTPGGYYYTGFPPAAFTPAVFTMPENEKYRKMLLRKQKRANKSEKSVANTLKAEDIDGHKDIDIDELLQSMGETVEEDNKKGKSKKVKGEKNKGKKEKRKGSSGEQAAAATDNVDNDDEETEDVKPVEEETNVVRNQFVEEDLMSFKQNFYLVNSDESRSRENGPIVEEILNSPSQSSFTKVTSKKNRGKKTKEEPGKAVEEQPRSYQTKPREKEFIRRKENSPETFPPVVEKQAPTPVPVVTDIESFPTLLKDDFPALPGGLIDTKGQLKENIKDTEPKTGAWSRVVTKASEDNRGHTTNTGAIDDHEKATNNKEDVKEEKVIVVEQHEEDEDTVIEDKVPKQEEEPETEVIEDVQETNEESDNVVDQSSICDEAAEEEMEILAEKISVVTTEEEFDNKETNEHSPVVIFSENNQDWTSSEFTFGFDVNEDLVANSNPMLETQDDHDQMRQREDAAQQYWHQSSLQHHDNAILSFGAATAGPGPDGVRPLIVGVPVGVPIPVSSYHQGLPFYPAPGPVLQYPYTFPFPGQPLPSDQEDPELAAKMADQCHEDATISPESGISSSSPLSWQPDASPSLAAAPGCYPTPGPLVSQVSKSLSNWKGHGSDQEEEGPGWATQVDMEQDNAQDSGLASENSLSSLKSRKTERFNIGEIVHFISDSWSSVSEDTSVPVFSAASKA